MPVAIPINPENVATRMAMRQRGRTDLYWLMTNVLGYKDIEPEVHGPIIEKLQQFKGGTDDQMSDGMCRYRPFVNLWAMEGPRKRLFLDARGHLKTTVITQSQAIQWVLNYPDIRILITTATGDLSGKILLEIRSHFQFNEEFRWLYPEYCPQAKKAGDWGNLEAFTVPNRERKNTKEPTISVSSVGKVIAGMHYEVRFESDMVDKENVKTPAGTQEVISHFNYMDPLLERHSVPKGSNLPNHGWDTVEGTRYSFADLYGKIIKDNEAYGGWQIFIRSAEVDAEKQITAWPSRFPWEELKRMEQSMGPYLYSSQMLNQPMADSGGLATESDVSGLFFNTEVYRRIRESLRVHVTVDLAGMEADSKGDYTVITTAGFDRDGRCYVLDIQRGRFTPSEVIDRIFNVNTVFRPIDIKIEKDAHARVLLPFLQREMNKRQQFPLLIPIKRDTHTSKIQRIKGLQPWFQADIIRFYEGITCKTDLIREIIEFPSSAHDDILDTIADQMQNREGGVNWDVTPDAPKGPSPWGQEPAPDRFIGFDPSTHEASWLYDQGGPSANFHQMTGL